MVNNKNNSNKRVLDEKITELFDEKTYDLIVHFKGFNNLFDYGVYNGKESINETHKRMQNHIQEIANEYMQEIKNNLNNQELNGKKLLLVWDGDDLEETQWTQVMIATAEKLKEQEAILEFLCCYNLKTDENPWGVENPTATLIQKGFEKNHIFKYGDLKVNNYNEVGMVLLYVTSNLINKNNKPILVLCAGGGQTPLDEYKFTKKNSTIVEDTNKYPLANKLINYMKPEKFKWMASKFIKSRKNKSKEDGVELSKMIPKNEIEMIKYGDVTPHQRVRLTSRGGARKKRTKTLKKKKKSSKKQSKKNKRKC